MSGRRWSKADVQLLAKLYAGGASQLEIASRLGIPFYSVRDKIKSLGLRRSASPRKQEEPHFNPVVLSLPKIKSRKLDSADVVSIHWSDCQIPFQDDRALDVLYQICRVAQPNELYAQGDTIDFWQISEHRPPLEHALQPDQVDIQDSINQTAEHLGIMQRESKASRLVYLGGNHEDRWDRLLTRIQRDTWLRSLLRIPKIRDTLTLPYVLGLRNWQYVSYLQQPAPVVRNRLVVTHGHRLGLWPTKLELLQFGKSVIFGHCHRIQSYTMRDLAGTDAAWSLGCLCELQPHWTRQPDWHHGFAIVTWKQVADAGWLFAVEQIRIHNGQTIWRDRVFRA